jgi:hypothetical protein
VCVAGLYHSVYSTENFKLSFRPSKEEILSIIGPYSEKLVSIFCSLSNRTSTILNNTLDLSRKIRFDLICIEYANLKEQCVRTNNIDDLNLCTILLNEIAVYKNFKSRVDTVIFEDKKIWVFDDLLENSQIEWINEYCTMSKYTPDHRSNGLNYEIDSRFVCPLVEEDIRNIKILPAVWEISRITNLKFDIKNAYINHYAIGTSVSKHCDSSVENEFTILIFCNKFWETTWGGEIAFYKDNSSFHSMVDVKPGRIILFDSRISHKVMPMTMSAKKDRYSIALKCKLTEK